MKNKMICLLAVLIASSASAETGVSVVERPDTLKQNSFYVGNRAPLEPSCFIALPIEAVQPRGWLLEMLRRQGDGLCGHLDEVSYWLQKDGNGWLSKDGHGKHGWEELAYWLRGYLPLAYLLNDPKMTAEGELWIKAVLVNQRPDGDFGSDLRLDRNEPRDFWPNMVMLFCLETYYEHANDPRVLNLMTKYFAFQLSVPDDQFLFHHDLEGVRAGDNLYSVYWLYNRTGDPKLLLLAEKIHHHTANWELKGDLPTWHNVNIAEGFREPATHYLQSHDPVELKATYEDFWEVRKRYGQVPGGMFGGDENCRPGYSDPHQAVETCGMVEQMFSDELLMQVTGDPMWADNCEDVAFNTYPAALTPDMCALRYLTAPNQVVSDAEDHSPGVGNGGSMMNMDPFSYRCCQHNHSMGWPYFAQHLWLATPDDGLCAAIYSASQVYGRVGNGTDVRIVEETHYPFEGAIHLTMHLERQARFPLYLRIPAWCESAAIEVNGEPLHAASSAGKYVRVERDWKEGDIVDLDLPMAVAIQSWTANKDGVSINYGPLTFSLEIGESDEREDGTKVASFDARWVKNADSSKWPAFALHPTTPWNYGLAIDPKDSTRSFRVTKRDWPSDNYPFSPGSNPVAIVAKAKKIPQWTLDQYGLCATLQESPAATDQPLEDVTLIPMGAARLRVSAFPTVSEDGAGKKWSAPNWTPPVIWSIHGAIEAEGLVESAQTNDGRAAVLSINKDDGNLWSNRRVLVWMPEEVGSELRLALPSKEGGLFRFMARVATGPNFGAIEFDVNGNSAGEAVDLYAPKLAPKEIWLGTVTLVPGDNTLVVKIVGKNPKSPFLFVALDAFALEPTATLPDPWGLAPESDK